MSMIGQYLTSAARIQNLDSAISVNAGDVVAPETMLRRLLQTQEGRGEYKWFFQERQEQMNYWEDEKVSTKQ